MKKILCYGDSNTYGFVPQNGARYNKTERWSGILAESLTPYFEVTEEGMNNRTGFFKNPEGLKQCGGEYLSIYLQNHKDFDICILALGTNDAQFFYNLKENSVEHGLKNLTNAIREANTNTQIIIVPPVKITENILTSMFSMMFDKNSISKIEKVFPIYEKFAKENGCLYFDFNEFAKPSHIDGLHYEKQTHKIIAQKLSEFIQTNFT